jgi:hypothetical protein
MICPPRPESDKLFWPARRPRKDAGIKKPPSSGGLERIGENSGFLGLSFYLGVDGVILAFVACRAPRLLLCFIVLFAHKLNRFFTLPAHADGLNDYDD